ncbi:hypothetical protein [Rhizobium rhizogenes]|uniref:hypothetical protein n=1 Tax=Rhizobium rhizogenes TaxID=359 RepID=UPI0004D9F62E|nr:hypothetical protein [Rhizobium rhizogenes]KEA07179.1 hypothetical protein CN09_09610 [Rhizobium rhizogenes]NTI80375.1 hypothetical protein [Rhizobium rhizogenes]NTJ22561.1 hypothetical protein [Rhizobium rhizogenes]QUE81267.1 hypothetical protein EML492_05525 [Rhizobium rhizogenes]TQO80633.1 hypothetical protein FFE80_05895 [Rhizobium rhizogenes]
MKKPIDKEWFEKRAAAERDLEIGAGRRFVPPAYDNCTCDCHSGSGKLHIVACCNPPKEDNGHLWHERVFSSMQLKCCMMCGFIKNEDQPNKACPGFVAVEVRGKDSSQ